MYSDLDSCVIIQRGLQRDPVLGDDGHPPHPAAALDPLECFFNFFCHGRVVTTGTVALCHCVTTRSPATLTVYNPPSSYQAPGTRATFYYLQLGSVTTSQPPRH